MAKIGIITIHKINNYGSVLQAYALQEICRNLGFEVEIIDYKFPNTAHANNPYVAASRDDVPTEPKWLKLIFAWALVRQHRGIAKFVEKYQNLSVSRYFSPEQLLSNPPAYDVYITGSDQVWNPRYCNGDAAFMLNFAPDDTLKISYAASFGTNEIPSTLCEVFQRYLSRYSAISVRELSGVSVIKKLIGRSALVVLDPTLLLNSAQWNKIATSKRLVKKKYILCYYLNYSFNAFPYVDNLASEIQRQTGFEIVYVARPPHELKIRNNSYRIGASPEEFLALIRDAEIVLTTSFHGTAFALNFGRPVFSIVKSKIAADSRQSNLMRNLGLESHVIELGAAYPDHSEACYDVKSEQKKLENLRHESISYLKNSLRV